jgi:hypothetical protein
MLNLKTLPDAFEGLHIICERDVGLFSLMQTVISHIPWALRGGRAPVAYFQEQNSYYTPEGYQGADTVWEYYFEPVVSSYPASSIPPHIRTVISNSFPIFYQPGYFAAANVFVTCQIGDHPDLRGKTLSIPYMLDDPDSAVRRQAGPLFQAFVRPRAYIREKAEQFYRQHMHGRTVIGVHIRGTDATSQHSVAYGSHRVTSLNFPNYVAALESLLKRNPDAALLVASDAQASVDYMKSAFGDRVVSYESIRHVDGEPAGQGPTGLLMPGYISRDPDLAARNGEEAVIEYLLLSRCKYLVHNGSTLARMVLLKEPRMPHVNTHPWLMSARTWRRAARERLRRSVIRIKNSRFFTTELLAPGQFAAGWPEWIRNGDVQVAPATGEARVTVNDTLTRILPVDDSIVYRYCLEAFSETPAALVRLQINWSDASGKFMGTTIETRQCGPRWVAFPQEMKPPAGARTGAVIVGGHTATPVLVRSVSLKCPACPEEDKYVAAPIVRGPSGPLPYPPDLLDTK